MISEGATLSTSEKNPNTNIPTNKINANKNAITRAAFLIISILLFINYNY